MRDEHLNYYGLSGGKILIRPKSGYRIFCILTRQTVSEAITTEPQLKYFTAVEGDSTDDTLDGVIPEQTVEERIEELNAMIDALLEGRTE